MSLAVLSVRNAWRRTAVVMWALRGEFAAPVASQKGGGQVLGLDFDGDARVVGEAGQASGASATKPEIRPTRVSSVQYSLCHWRAARERG